MSKLMSTNYSTGAFNLGTLLLRLTAGGLMVPHGFQKLANFSSVKGHFINFLGIGSATSLALCIFAELLCAALLVIGLFSRLAAIPLIINMAVVFFMVQHSKAIGNADGELSLLYLIAYLVLLITGPGKISVDGMAGK